MDMTQEQLHAHDAPPTPDTERRTNAGVTITAEMVVYILLFVIALLTRVADLGKFPLGAFEARESLAAYRAINPEAAGGAITAAQPLAFTFNAIFLSIFGADGGVARLPTALVGALIVLIPLLYRRWLGVGLALLMAAGLAASPVLFMASREMSGAVWSVALALLGVALLGRFIETARSSYAIAATTAFVLLVLMAEPAGFITALLLVIGVVFALASTAADDENNLVRATLAEIRAAFPVAQALPIAGLVVVALATVFLTYPSGISGIAEVVGRGLRGFVARPDGYPLAYPLLLSLLHEPVLWIFGAAGAYLVIVDDFGMGEADGHLPLLRFFGRVGIGWFIGGVIFSLIYAGAHNDHALWLTLPLTALSAIAVNRLFAPIRSVVPGYVPLIHALASIGILSIISINLIMAGRTLQQYAATYASVGGQISDIFLLGLILALTITAYVVIGTLVSLRFAPLALIVGIVVFALILARAVIPLLTPELTQTLPGHVSLRFLMVFFAAALFLISFFLVGSMYDNGTAWRGLALGMLLFLNAYGLSIGWRAAINEADNAADLWHINPSGRNLTLVEQTLEEASLRSMGTRYDIDVVAQTADDSPIAWMLRRFHKTQFVSELSSTVNTRAVIARWSVDEPTLGGDYVGQQFAADFTWDRAAVQTFDLLTWLYDRKPRVAPVGKDKMILYLRSDVYGLQAGQ